MILKSFSFVALIVIVGVSSALGQTTPPAQEPKPVSPASPRPPAPPQIRTATPQVVTVLHRLKRPKMFRLLLHSEQGVEAIANLDNTFTLMDDVHTNVIAGLALEDGQTIAARLPEVDVEFTFPVPPPPRTPTASTPDPFFSYTGSLFQSPDLTVIDSEGKKVMAQFVGVDGATGFVSLKTLPP